MTADGPILPSINPYRSAPHFPGQTIVSSIHDFTFMVAMHSDPPRFSKPVQNQDTQTLTGTQTAVVERPPTPRIRQMEQARKGLAVSCVKAIEKLVDKDADYTKFNKIADHIKTRSGWETIVKSATLGLDDAQVLKLMRTPAHKFRGYDRVVLKEILGEVKFMAESRSLGTPAERESLGNFIDSLETLTLTVNESDMTLLGGGAVNKVFLVKYTDPKSGEKVEAVFKPDPADLDALTKLKEAKFGTAAASGIPPGPEGHLPSRAVASSKVDQLLFGDQAVSVKTQFVTVNGRRGILMQKAKGKTPKTGVIHVEEGIDFNKNPELRQLIIRELTEHGKVSEETLKMIAVSKKYDAVEFKGDWQKFRLIGKKEVRQLNPQNPATVSGLIRLQIKDIICGECDRHPENYFIDYDGNVTGIDEDCCFGVNALPEGDVRAQDPIVIVPGIAEIPNNASLMLRMPPVVTREMYEQVKALSVNLKFHQVLYEHVTFEEAAAALERTSKLIQHMDSDQCKIVDTDAELISKDSLSRLNTNNSLLVREILVQRGKGEKGWNSYRAHRKDKGLP